MLRCCELFKAFDGVQALHNFSAEFNQGTVSAVIGPNGAGKTTLLNVITGFVRPDRGSCYLEDMRISPGTPHRIAKQGIIRTFQDLRLIMELSVLENVLLAFSSQRGEKAIAALLGVWKPDEMRFKEAGYQHLDDVGLADHAALSAAELSYGQQKLLTLACCFAAEADVLLLDEPVSGVAPNMIEKILQLLESASNQGKAIVFVEHDLNAVRRIASTVFVMDCGSVVCHGPTEEVLNSKHVIKVYTDS